MTLPHHTFTQFPNFNVVHNAMYDLHEGLHLRYMLLTDNATLKCSKLYFTKIRIVS